MAASVRFVTVDDAKDCIERAKEILGNFQESIPQLYTVSDWNLDEKRAFFDKAKKQIETLLKKCRKIQGNVPCSEFTSLITVLDDIKAICATRSVNDATVNFLSTSLLTLLDRAIRGSESNCLRAA